MKIALIGYGNMGQEIERLVKNTGTYQIVSISYKNKSDKLDKTGIKKADVALDFTSAEIVLKNMEEVLGLGKKMVVGTTGWYEDIEKVKKLVEKNRGGLIFGKNFSVGANIFFKIIAQSSNLFDKYGGYDVYAQEVHHSRKKDSPSGTAREIADIIIANTKNKKSAQFDKLDRQIKPYELHFSSVRSGYNSGFHRVVFDSAADEISLSHQARNRSGFAEGALLAAKFIINKKGTFVFEDQFEKGKI